MLLASMAVLFAVDSVAQTTEQVGDTVTSTQPSRFRLGLLFNIATRSESVDLVVPGFAPDCGRLGEGSGSSWSIGGLLDYAVVGRIRLFGSVSFERSSGTLIRRGDPFPIRGESGAVVDGRVDQVVSTSGTGLSFDLLASTPISERISLMAGAGLWTRLLTEEEHREVAVSPSTLLLANDAREMVVADGVLLDHRPVLPRLVAGLRYDLPIGRDSWFSPELRASWTILDRVTDGSWRSLSLALGGSVRFGLPEGDHAIEIPQPADTLVALPVVIPRVRTFPEVVQVEVTEYDSTEAVPLLDRIFFEKGSTMIPDRYVELDLPASVSFTTAQLDGPTLDVYYNVLNVIGLRMNRLPLARLRLTGYRSSDEPDTALGVARAEAVERYLREVWEIPEDRFELRGRGLPDPAANERIEQGREENRIVTIETTDATITSPVLRRFIQRVATPPSVTFYPNVIAEGGVDSWELVVETNDGPWKRFTGRDSLPRSIEWSWRSDEGELPSIPLELRYRLSVTDTLGTTGTTPWHPIRVAMKTLQEKLVEQQQDTIIESYSLLLFTYGSPEVSRADRALLAAIASRVGPGARVRFTGYTDSLGNEETNRRLAVERATNAATIFEELVDDAIIEVNNEGGEKERYPYGTPEGRSYDRTVIIEVRTPIIRTEPPPELEERRSDE